MRAEERKAKLKALAVIIGSLLAQGSDWDKSNTIEEIFGIVINLADDIDWDYSEMAEDAYQKWLKEIAETEVVEDKAAMIADQQEDEWKL